jgi:two-component system CheB/CheR fusion protein
MDTPAVEYEDDVAPMSPSRKNATLPDAAADTTASPPAHEPPPLIVGIGASAGGLEAYKSFFAHIAPDGAIAYVLVQHLSPDHSSMLVELLSRHTPMPVHEASDGAVVHAGHVYVIPPDATLTIREGVLQVSKPAPPRQYRWPIDSFFVSLAEDQGENAVGVVLSGSGSDGARGLRAIKERGGLVLAQAGVDHVAMTGMPASAAATGVVDDVIPVEAMPGRLAAHHEHLQHSRSTKGPDGTRRDVAAHVQTICAMMRDQVGHDFGQYKEKTLIRRIQRRMQVAQTHSVEGYIAYLQENPREIDNLFHELLIGVTEFFRDPEAFEILQGQAIPILLKDRTAADTLRVWVPACATGEEAYSIAIALSEAMAQRHGGPKVQIFATDIDDRAINSARSGRFRAPLHGVSPERLERWFVQDGDHYVVVKPVREMIVFSPHSAIKDPPFSRLDLVSCRNLLIYLNAELQEHVIRMFHYALRPGGVLLLGPSESLGRNTAMFSILDKKHRIYQRRSDGRGALPIATAARMAAVDSSNRAFAVRTNTNEDVIDRNARRALERHAPAYVVVDGSHEILRFFGDTGRYLGPSSGAASLNLFGLLHKGLRAPARTALQQAVARQATVVQEGQVVARSGDRVPVRLIAEPIFEQDEKDERRSSLCMLIFKELAPIAVTPAPAETPSKARGGPNEASRTQELELELATTREQLHTAIDELETANEEMKSANEEYQSVNEELQSSNEELETSKEEMQSINEELQTVNVELNSKNDALGRLNSDLQNLLESTQIATLFLDSSLHVSGFTPAISDLFHLREGDHGRPITEITARIPYAELKSDVKQVLRTLAMVERVLQGGINGSVYLLRMRPYRTTDNVIDGVVLTFIDITERQQHEYERGRLAAIVESSQDAIIGHAVDGTISSWNKGAERMFGYPAGRVIGRSLSMLLPQDALEEMRTLLGACAGDGGAQEELVMTWLHRDGNQVPVSLRCSPVLDHSGAMIGGSTIARDISERKRAARRLEESERRLADVIDQATVGLAQFDLGGHITDANPWFCEIIGRGLSDMRGRHIRTFTHPDDVQESDELLAKLAADGTPYQVEKRYVRPDGSWVWVSAHVSLIHDEDGKPLRLASVVLDITQRKLAAEHREMLLGELNHRVKNTLATVQAIASQTLSIATDLPGFRESFFARLQSLSRTHNVLAKESWRGANLDALVHAELAPFLVEGRNSATVAGETVQLSPRDALAMSLALHELATNAAKHGALGTAEGRVHVAWVLRDHVDARWLELQWKETGGPPVGEPSRRGFGTRLVTEGIQHELGGKVVLDFARDGVSCKIAFPLQEEATG